MHTGETTSPPTTEQTYKSPDVGAPEVFIVGLSWQQRSACAKPGVDPEIFYPDRGGSSSEARAICSRCPVRAECLEYALEEREPFGIWGGTSERERRVLLRAEGRPKKRRKQRTLGPAAIMDTAYLDAEDPWDASEDALEEIHQDLPGFTLDDEIDDEPQRETVVAVSPPASAPDISLAEVEQDTLTRIAGWVASGDGHDLDLVERLIEDLEPGQRQMLADELLRARRYSVYAS